MRKIIRTEFLTVFHFLCASFIWIGCVFILIINISCIRDDRKLGEEEKQRGIEDVFPQGVTDNLYGIKKFHVVELPSSQLDEDILRNEALKIKTSRTGEKAKVSSSTHGIFIDPEAKTTFINQYYFLDYRPIKVETEDQKLLLSLLGEVEFKGFPDTVYHIVPHLENNYLILYRLSDPEKVPYDELPISLKIGSKVATPLVGYPIKYCIAEQKRDPATNEKIRLNRLKCGVSKTSARYILLEKDQKNVFKYLPKEDLFRKNFFLKGKWFFVKTIIGSSNKSEIGIHQPFASAHLIKFIESGGSLRVVDATGDVKGNTEDNNESCKKEEVTGFSIPVEWKEYEIARDSDVIKSFGEREVNLLGKDIDKTYLRIKLKELVQGEVKHLVQKEEGTGGTVVAEPDTGFITDDYFHFVVKISGSSSRRIKYAFKKVVENPNYVEKKWFEEDSHKFFPSFSVSRLYCEKASDPTVEARDRFERTTRFDPNSSSGSVKVIKWYFSKQTPQDEWIRDLGRRAVNYWNKVFQEAGKDSNYKIRVVLDKENKDKELGDIRYNIINLVVSDESEGNTLGYGPRIANPITGEILSATANVWVTNIIKQYITLIRKYIRFHIYPPSWKLLPESPGVTDFVHEKIQKLCSSGDSDNPDVVEFIRNEKKQGRIFHPFNTTLQDTEIIDKCARKMAEIDILNTLLHEMGHCFGYRHVFSASADKDNFYESYDEIRNIFDEDILEDSTNSYSVPAQFSSVMDYGHPHFPGLTVPGKYDIAITKFLYFDKVDLVDGKTMNISAGADSDNPQKKILEVIGEKPVKGYKVCGGKKPESNTILAHLLSDRDLNDPLCIQYDYGTTPLEVVNNEIRSIQDNIMFYSKRYDDEKVEFPAVSLNKIIRISQEWIRQLALLFQSVNMDITDYSFVNDNDVQAYLSLIEDERDRNEEFNAYYGVRQSIFDFYKKMFFLPVKQCVYRKENGTYQAVALDVILTKIQKKYPRNLAEIVMSCKSPAIEKWATENTQGTLVTEVGSVSENRKYVLNPTIDDEYDEMSVFNLYWSLIIDAIGGVLLANDPYFARQLVTKQMDAFLNGMDLTPYISDLDKKKFNDKELPRFLSYNIEKVTNVVLAQKPVVQGNKRGIMIIQGPLLLKKQQIVNSYVDSVLPGYEVKGKAAEVRKKYGYKVVSRSDQWLRDLLGEQDMSVLEAVHPAIYGIREEYESNSKEKSLLSFLMKHPAVCVSADLSKILIPHDVSKSKGCDVFENDNCGTSEDNDYVNDYAKMCRKFNEYKTCVANHNKQPCEHVNDKKAYIQQIGVMMM